MRFAIVHSLDGYDEISLTGDFKYILDGAEEIISPEKLGYSRTTSAALNGGTNVQEAASIFLNVLKGKGTEAQMNVVIANTQMALLCYYPDKTAETCKDIAEESLKSGRALAVFNKLISMQS
jgi:anthranilate phosphoribosyltransferase